MTSRFATYILFSLLAIVIASAAFGDEDWSSELPANAGNVVHVGRKSYGTAPKETDGQIIRIRGTVPSGDASFRPNEKTTAILPFGGYAIRPDPIFHLK